MAFSSRLRSRISFWAAVGLSQKPGSSACAFSSSRRFWALSQSKTPPQQLNRLLDIIGMGLQFGAHGNFRPLQGVESLMSLDNRI